MSGVSNPVSPGTYVGFVNPGPSALPGVATDIGGFEGAAVKGPVNTPTLITSPDLFSAIYGPDLSGSFLAEAVRDFFSEGGQSCYVNRVASLTSAPATAALTLSTAAGAATSGEIISSTGAFPVALANGDTFVGEEDAGSGQTATVSATRPSITGTVSSFGAGITSSDYITILVSGYPASQKITFAGTETTEAAFIATINSQLMFAVAEDNGSGHIKILASQAGTGASIQVVATSTGATTYTGFSAGSAVSGTGNVANLGAVQATELAAIFNAAFITPGATAVGNNTTGQLTVSSNTTGSSSKFQFTGGTGVAKISGFDTSAHNGSAAGSGVSTLLIDASSPGAWGNAYRVVTTNVNTTVATAVATTAGSYTSLTVSSVSRIAPGDTLSITATGGLIRGIVQSVNPVTQQVTFTTSITVPVGGLAGTEAVVDETFNVVVYDNTNNVAIGGTFNNLRMSPLAGTNYAPNAINSGYLSPITATDLLASASDPRPINTTSLLSGGSDGGSLTDSDYRGTASAYTGIYAFNLVSGINYVSIPGITTVAVHQEMQTFANQRQDVFVFPDLPQGYSPSQAITYIQSTANLSSMCMAVYYPWVRAVNILTNTTVSYPNSGHVQGIWARVHQQTNISQAAAGTPLANLNNIVGLDYNVRQTDYDLLYPARINAIQTFKGQGTSLEGCVTLDGSGAFPLTTTVYLFQVISRQLKSGTRFVNFLPNNSDTQLEVVKVISTTLSLYRQTKVLAGATDAQAFFVECNSNNNTPAVVAAGRLLCRVGIATQIPSQFVIFTLEQFTAPTQNAVASAQQPSG